MSKGKIVFLLYQKDFSENGQDRYFIFDDGKFSEVDSAYVVSIDCFLVTHDFWLISNSLYKNNQILPSKVIDVVLLAKIVAGSKSVDSDVQSWDISKTIKPLFTDPEDFNSYMDIYYRRKDFDYDLYMLFSHKLADYFERVSKKAFEVGEIDRFYELELPLYNILTLAACKGIRVDNSIIRKHKENLQLDFYRELKFFSEKHNVLYELPDEGSIREKLSDLGYNVQDYTLDFLIDFLPSKGGYTDDLRNLQKTNKSYRVYNSISSSSNRLNPIVEPYWTSTSRIYHKSPSIQNISKKYRDIFIPDDGKNLCYVDYDQFEVGVMAHVSADPKMKEIYQNSDAYEDLAINVFEDKDMRKKTKIMFLSYTYGMSIENILSSVKEMGGNENKAREYFSEFTVFESWKSSIWEEFIKNGRIGTISGNYLNRVIDGNLTEKEKRTSVNHIIQGTATYVFKCALLELSKVEGLDILIPMHDAVLIQHIDKVKPEEAKKIFERVMTRLLPSVLGKASLEEFYALE
ncbi:DNA polymerase [Vibrio furnissii]|uniref:DNA polymerase n=1 Tax=Vibrio furnissii TaxID=29494 RepID=UPI00163D4F40|nr:DNA polymerase [Vibrio furnissii]